MTTLLLSIALFGLAMAGMAAGVIFSDRKLKGSCGGSGGKDCVCDIEKRRACARKKGLPDDEVVDVWVPPALR